MEKDLRETGMEKERTGQKLLGYNTEAGFSLIWAVMLIMTMLGNSRIMV